MKEGDRVGLNLKFITERRSELGLKQEDIAARLGMDRASYCRYENGVYKLNAEDIPTLAAALKCPISVLFDTSTETPKPVAKANLREVFEAMTKQLMVNVTTMPTANVSPETIKELRENVRALGYFK